MKKLIEDNMGIVGVYLIMFFAPIKTAIWGMIALVIIDTLTGIYAAYKKGGWKAITSSKLKSIIPKVLIYVVLIIAARILEIIGLDFVPWIQVSVGIVAIVELKSIWENASKILGYNLWKYLRAYLLKGKEGIKKELDEKNN